MVIVPFYNIGLWAVAVLSVFALGYNIFVNLKKKIDVTITLIMK